MNINTSNNKSTLYVITGASRGIGAGLVAAALDQGSCVLALARSAVPTQARLTYQCADFSQPGGIATAIESMQTLVAQLTPQRLVLINNAAVLDPVGLSDALHLDALDQHWRVNISAPMLLGGAALALARKGLQTVVLNISSGAAKRPKSGWAAYCAGKAALEMLTLNLAADAEQLAVPLKAIALAPGIVDTEMQSLIRSKSTDAFPDVAQFVQYQQQGMLQESGVVGQKIIQWISNVEFNALTNGLLTDIKQIA